MNRDEQIIGKYFSGYIDISEEDGYYHLYRFKQPQREYYASKGEWFGLQSHCQAGIRIEVDNCTRVAFDFVCKTAEVTEASFDVIHADGSEEEFKFPLVGGRAEFSFDGENIVIYFCYKHNVGIKNIEVCGDEPQNTDRNILAFGDSITQGYVIEKSAFAYPVTLAKAFDTDFYNFGISGYYLDPGVLNELELLPKPWIITFAYGTNDWEYENNGYRENIIACFKRLYEKYPDTPICVVLPLKRIEDGTKKNGIFVEDIRNDLRTEAAKYPNFYVMECGSKLDIAKHTCEDGLHPNDEGMRFIGKLLAEEIKQKLGL